MAQLILLCDSADIDFSQGYPDCFGSGWQTVEASVFSSIPLADLTVAETGSLMAATAAFLALCWAGRTIVRSAFHSGND